MICRRLHDRGMIPIMIGMSLATYDMHWNNVRNHKNSACIRVRVKPQPEYAKGSKANDSILLPTINQLNSTLSALVNFGSALLSRLSSTDLPTTLTTTKVRERRVGIFLSLSAVRALSSLQVCCAWLATRPAHQHEPEWIRPSLRMRMPRSSLLDSNTR